MCQVGLLTPEPAATQQLRTGQVGYVITGMKSTRSARLGDTWHLLKQPVDPLPGFKPVKSMVFAGPPLSQPCSFSRNSVHLRFTHQAAAGAQPFQHADLSQHQSPMQEGTL